MYTKFNWPAASNNTDEKCGILGYDFDWQRWIVQDMWKFGSKYDQILKRLLFIEWRQTSIYCIY